MLIIHVYICIYIHLQGGFGAAVLEYISEAGHLDRGTLRIRTMFVPDIWIETGPQKDQYDIASLNQPHIVEKANKLLDAIRNNRLAT